MKKSFPFPHPYNNGRPNIQEMNGYTKCLMDLMNYIQGVTEDNPEKRMIDSVQILEKITETCKEFSAIFEKEKAQLDKEANF